MPCLYLNESICFLHKAMFFDVNGMPFLCSKKSHNLFLRAMFFIQNEMPFNLKEKLCFYVFKNNCKSGSEIGL